MTQRSNICEEITGTPLDAKHKKSILWGLLDKETKAAVVQWQARDEKEIMRQVMLYINGTTAPAPKTTPTTRNSGGGATPMQLGSMNGAGQKDENEGQGEGEAYWDWSGEAWTEQDQEEHLNAMKGEGKGGKCKGKRPLLLMRIS